MMDIFPEPDSRTASRGRGGTGSRGDRISNPLSVKLLKLNMRTRMERDKLWLLQCRATPLHRDLWGIVVSYYADDPRIVDLISPGIRLHLSARYVFSVDEYSGSSSSIELSGFITPSVMITDYWSDRDHVGALSLFQMILILPVIYVDGSESADDDPDTTPCSDSDSESNDSEDDNYIDPDVYIPRYISQIRDKLYKRLAELDDAAA